MSKRLVWGAPSFWIERLPLYYERHKSFFQEQGLSVDIRYFWGGPELAHAVEQRQVLIGEMGLPPFFKSFSQGLSAHAIGSSIIQQLDHYLVGRPEIEGIKDWGIPTGALRPFCLEKWTRAFWSSRSWPWGRAGGR